MCVTIQKTSCVPSYTLYISKWKTERERESAHACDGFVLVSKAA